MEEVPFIGPSYQASSKFLDTELSINLYPEFTESINGKSKMVLKNVPGKLLWTALPVGGVRGMHVIKGFPDRLFVVSSKYLYEVMQSGLYSLKGELITQNNTVSMEHNQTQLMLNDGSALYILNLESSAFDLVGDTTLTELGNPNAPLYGATGAFIDNYFVTHQANTNRWGLSALGNGLSWDDLDQASKEGKPDNIVAVHSIRRELVLFGQISTEFWYNTGEAAFPFSIISGVFLEIGLAAVFSVVLLDNTIYFIGYTKHGWGVVYRLNGYTVERVSNHAVEYALNRVGSISDAVCYGYQEEGHSYYVINAPNLSQTMVFDAATNMWHTRQSTTSTGLLTRDRAQHHAFCFGIHLLGDYENGNIYASSLEYYTDYDKPLRKIRISPHYYSNLKYIFFDSLQLDMEVGVGAAVGDQTYTDPQIMMKMSNDGGNSWGNERWKSIGKIGEYKKRVRWTQLGKARDRVFWLEVSDPVKVVLINANLGFTVNNT